MSKKTSPRRASLPLQRIKKRHFVYKRVGVSSWRLYIAGLYVGTYETARVPDLRTLKTLRV